VEIGGYHSAAAVFGKGEVMTKTEPPACVNTDKEIWRRVPGDYYSPSLHVTKEGCIGLDVGGSVTVMAAEHWNKATTIYLQLKEAVHG
jgi:hypothetical protein